MNRRRSYHETTLEAKDDRDQRASHLQREHEQSCQDAEVLSFKSEEQIQRQSDYLPEGPSCRV